MASRHVPNTSGIDWWFFVDSLVSSLTPSRLVIKITEHSFQRHRLLLALEVKGTHRNGKDAQEYAID